MCVKLTLRFIFCWITHSYKLLIEIYSSVITRKFPNCQNRFCCHLSHTHSAVRDFTDCFICLPHSTKCCTSERVCITEPKPPEKPHQRSGRRLLWIVDVQGKSEGGSLRWKVGINNFHLQATNVQNLHHCWATKFFFSFFGYNLQKHNLQVTYTCKHSNSKQQLFQRAGGKKEPVLND